MTLVVAGAVQVLHFYHVKRVENPLLQRSLHTRATRWLLRLLQERSSVVRTLSTVVWKSKQSIQVGALFAIPQSSHHFFQVRLRTVVMAVPVVDLAWAMLRFLQLDCVRVGARESVLRRVSIRVSKLFLLLFSEDWNPFLGA